MLQPSPAARGHGTLVFDGDCGFCTTSAGWARRLAPDATVVAWQQTDLDALGIDRAAAVAALQFVDTHGRVSGGAAAVARFLVDAGLPWSLLGRLLLLPGVRRLAAAAYGLVADNRYWLPGGTPACRL
jgi:predicted DCC family thiol-disulfide oxidoreductase YuxK